MAVIQLSFRMTAEFASFRSDTVIVAFLGSSCHLTILVLDPETGVEGGLTGIDESGTS
jgi:hypothetical protein